MALSKIEITFNSLPVEETSFIFQDTALGLTFAEVFVALRTQSEESQIGVDIFQSAYNFASAFNADHNAVGIYTVSLVLNVVTIKSTNANSQFSIISNPVGGTVTGVVTNNNTVTPYVVDTFQFLEATTNDPCTHYKVSIETSLVTKFMSGTVSFVSPNTDNPFTFELLRGQSFNITLTEDGGQTINLNYTSNNVPSLLNENRFEIVIINSPNGSTVIVNSTDINVLTLEYSLDNTNWQTSNEFTGLLPDTYTLYVRDDFGCSFSTSFTTDEIGTVRVPYFKMPKSNAIRYANRVTWGDCGNYKNDENTFCHETDDVEEPKGYIQDWQSCDIVPTYFETNYTNLTATLIKEDGTEINLSISQMSSYMGVKDRRDARKYDLGDGKTGIYFTTGNLYDYDTEADTGNDYVLNGLLPEWGVAGNYIRVDTIWYLIEDVVTSETKNAEVLVISNNYTGADVAVIASCIYNLENYEEYEYNIDMVGYIGDTFQVKLECTDSDFTTITHLSECQNVEIKKPGTVAIQYKNSVNTDINFSRGLEFVLRFYFEKIYAKPDEETELNKTDNSAYLSESEIREVDVFEFSPLPKQMMHLLVLALSHDTVTIRGVAYRKAENINIEGPLESTNLYDVTASMMKVNSAFNSNIVQGSPSVNAGDIEIPGLVEHDNGYVKY